VGSWAVGLLGSWALRPLGSWAFLGLLGSWALGLLGPWVLGSLGSWALGTCLLRCTAAAFASIVALLKKKLLSETLSQIPMFIKSGDFGHLGPCALGLALGLPGRTLGSWAGPWALVLLGRWALGPLNTWAVGLLGRWALGLLGLSWAIGLLGPWATCLLRCTDDDAAVFCQHCLPMW
jgi:hypothetical protein